MNLRDLEKLVDETAQNLDMARELKKRGKLAAPIELGLKFKYGIELEEGEGNGRG